MKRKKGIVELEVTFENYDEMSLFLRELYENPYSYFYIKIIRGIDEFYLVIECNGKDLDLISHALGKIYTESL